MDVADAFARSFDRLRDAQVPTLTMARWIDRWMSDPDARGRHAMLIETMKTSAEAPDQQVRGVADPEALLMLCWAADSALAVMNPWYGAAEPGPLQDVLRARYEDTGRLDTATLEEGGMVLPKWREPQRPAAVSERLEDFFHHVVRVTAHSLQGVVYHPAQGALAADASDRDELRAGNATVGCVPLLADMGQLSLRRVEYAGESFYALSQRDGAIDPPLVEVLAEKLGQLGVMLATLPEAALTEQLLDRWKRVMRSSARAGTSPSYVLVGSGPVGGGDPPRNRAVLLDRFGRQVLQQDKQRRYTIPRETFEEWGVSAPFDHGGPFGEWIDPGDALHIAETPLGRIAILVCEDLSRTGDFQQTLREWGVSIVFVPVFSKELHERGWEQRYAFDLVLDGATVVVVNSLVVERRRRALGLSDARGPIHCALVAPGGRPNPTGYPPRPRCNSATEGTDVAVLPLPIPRTP